MVDPDGHKSFWNKIKSAAKNVVAAVVTAVAVVAVVAAAAVVVTTATVVAGPVGTAVAVAATAGVVAYVVSEIPDKETHYNRNELNTDIPLKENDVPSDWISSNDPGGPKAECHQYSAPNRDNVKYVSPDGHREAIYDKNGDLVTDPKDMGTYNFCPSNIGVDGLIRHFIKDMLPWYLYGNSKDDTTTMWERVTMRNWGE